MEAQGEDSGGRLRPLSVGRRLKHLPVEIHQWRTTIFSSKGERTPLTINEVYCVEIKSEGDRYDDGPKRTARKQL
jgi:hypothetical protein